MKYCIHSENIFLEDKIFNGYILINNGKIESIQKEKDDSLYFIDLKAFKVFPGFIDIHVHGGNGFDTMDSTVEAINEISKFKILEGVTSFCPATVTSSIEKTKSAIVNIKNIVQTNETIKVGGAKVIGSFLEGPFISKEYKGAHEEKFISEIDMNLIGNLIELGEGTIKSVAIAPEKDNAESAVKFLKNKGVNVRIGHSNGDINNVKTAETAGANIAIHTYNAMSGFNHRKEGMLGAVLTNDNIYCELIADLIHTNKTAIEILVRCKNDKIILITDCMSAGGLKDGMYKLGDLDVKVSCGSVRLVSDGSLAGSVLTLMDAVKNMYRETSLPLIKIINMASLNPAKALGLENEIGRIRNGNTADIIAVNDDFSVKFAMLNGEIVLKK